LLVFYTENQGVVVWAISTSDLASENPPIWSAQNEAVLEPELEFEDAVGFFRAMLYLQLSPGYRFTRHTDFPLPGAASRLSSKMDTLHVPGSRWKGVHFYGHDGKLVALFDDNRISAMGRTLADLEWISRALEIDWATDMDEPARVGGAAEDYARCVIAELTTEFRLEDERRLRWSRNNDSCRGLNQRMLREAIPCPHCSSRSQSHRYFEAHEGGKSYFVCTKCGCSFDADQFHAKRPYP
jgi:hypothetical protein